MDEHGKHLKAISARCFAARKKLKLSYRKAGEVTGVPFNSIARIESGQVEPTIDTLSRLAKGYGVTLQSLLCGT